MKITMDEIIDDIAFTLGIPANDNIEGLDFVKCVQMSFRQIRKDMQTPTHKTVPYATRIDLEKVNIITDKILHVWDSAPKVGVTYGSVDTGNVFHLAATVNTQMSTGSAGLLNIDPIMTELGLAQLRNTLSTDKQYIYDASNNFLYCTHKDPKPATITVVYVPLYKDVSEITNQKWIDFIYRQSLANAKVALGRSRSKYKVEGSNVSLDGETLLSEGNAELEQIREEIENSRNKFVAVN